MITRQDTIDAWRKIVNAVNANECLRNCVVRITDKFNNKELKASYDPSKKYVYVSENLDKDELLSVLAHEACHVLERDVSEDVLLEKDVFDFYNVIESNELERTPAGLAALQLMMEIIALSKEWTDENKVDQHIDNIDDCLDELESIKLSGETKVADFWNWIARNMDKIDNSVDYDSCGGHNEKWLDFREDFEKNGIEISIAY